MKGILADVNIEGYVDVLVARMCADPWKVFWDHVRLKYYRFNDVGLASTSADSLVWQVCQDNELALITDNRNDDGLDSLEATIRARNAPTSLPVFTISDVQRLKRDRPFGDRVIESLLVYLLYPDSFLGAGRLYLP